MSSGSTSSLLFHNHSSSREGRGGAHLWVEELRLVEPAGALRLVLAAGDGHCVVVAGVPGGGCPAAQVNHSTALQLWWEGGREGGGYDHCRPSQDSPSLAPSLLRFSSVLPTRVQTTLVFILALHSLFFVILKHDYCTSSCKGISKTRKEQDKQPHIRLKHKPAWENAKHQS